MFARNAQIACSDWRRHAGSSAFHFPSEDKVRPVTCAEKLEGGDYIALRLAIIGGAEPWEPPRVDNDRKLGGPFIGECREGGQMSIGYQLKNRHSSIVSYLSGATELCFQSPISLCAHRDTKIRCLLLGTSVRYTEGRTETRPDDHWYRAPTGVPVSVERR